MLKQCTLSLHTDLSFVFLANPRQGNLFSIYVRNSPDSSDYGDAMLHELNGGQTKKSTAILKNKLHSLLPGLYLI